MLGNSRRMAAMRLASAAPLSAALPALAMAQDTTAPKAGDPVGTLMMFTLGAALAIGVLLLASFLRKRSNREAMRRLNDE